MSDRRRPNLFLVGAMKAGTTSMHRYLSQHPDIFMSVRKEPRYSGFAPDLDSGSAADGRWFTRDLGDYLANFAAARDERMVGESSHVYLHSSEAARLIHEFSPDARILIMLRDPVQLIHSRHQQQVWMVREDIKDFGEALAAEEDRRAGRRLPPDAPYSKGLLYRDACTMAPQVSRYFDTFGRDRVQVVLLEDLSRRPVEIYREILEFLGVDPDFVPDRMEAVNPSKDVRSPGLQRLRLRLMHVGRVIRRRVPVPPAGVFSAPIKLLRVINRRSRSDRTLGRRRVKAIILCAGSGTRLLPRTRYMPKTLMPVCGRRYSTTNSRPWTGRSTRSSWSRATSASKCGALPATPRR